MSGSSCTSLAAYVLASYHRSDERSAEAGLKYFVLGALASGILLYGISLLYGFTGTTGLRRHRRRVRARRHAFDRPAVRPRVRARRPRLQDQRGAVPHVDARRLRRRADAGHRLLRLGAQGRRRCCSRPASASSAGPGDRRLAADRHLRGAWPRSCSARVAAFGQTNIKRLLAYSSINNVGFALVGLAAGGAAGRVVGAVLHGGLRRDDAGRLPRACCGCATQNGQPVETHRQPVRPVADPAGASPRRWRSSCSASPASRRLFGFWPKLLVFQAAVDAGLVALAVAGILGTVIGAYYYLKIVKIMYFDEPAPPSGRVRAAGRAAADPARGAGRLAARLSADRAARPRSPTAPRDRSSEPHPHRRADRLDQRRPAGRRPGGAEGDWLVAMRADSGPGAAGRAVVSRPGQFLRQHPGRACSPAIRRRRRCRWPPGWR